MPVILLKAERFWVNYTTVSWLYASSAHFSTADHWHKRVTACQNSKSWQTSWHWLKWSVLSFQSHSNNCSCLPNSCQQNYLASSSLIELSAGWNMVESRWCGTDPNPLHVSLSNASDNYTMLLNDSSSKFHSTEPHHCSTSLFHKAKKMKFVWSP